MKSSLRKSINCYGTCLSGRTADIVTMQGITKGSSVRAYSIDDQFASMWRPTTLTKLGKGEAYLEQLIATDPLILGLDPYVTGLGSDFVTFRQRVLTSPTGRKLLPDVVILTSTGHVLIVEVKLGSNQELRDRRVIAQIVDYAAAISSLPEDRLAGWLGAAPETPWADFIHQQFPNVVDARRLAAVIADRINRADIHLAVACDVAPEGLIDTMRQISSQAALGEYQLHLVELIPHENTREPGKILIIPNEVARTEIVTRTSVTVSADAGSQVSLQVSVSSPEETVEAIKGAQRKIRPEFQAIVDGYNLAADEGIPAIRRTVGYRQILVPGWPQDVHYELLDATAGPGSVGAELHIERDAYPELRAAFEAIASSPEGRALGVEFDPDWNRGGRLRIVTDVQDAQCAVGSMKDLIALTRGQVQSALKDLAGS